MAENIFMFAIDQNFTYNLPEDGRTTQQMDIKSREYLITTRIWTACLRAMQQPDDDDFNDDNNDDNDDYDDFNDDNDDDDDFNDDNNGNDDFTQTFSGNMCHICLVLLHSQRWEIPTKFS